MTGREASEKSWNMAQDYFRTVAYWLHYAESARNFHPPDAGRYYEGLRSVFDMASPYCWKSLDDTEYQKFLAELESISAVMFSDQSGDLDPIVAGRHMTGVIDALDSFKRKLLWRMKERQVLAPIFTERDPYNSP